MGEARVSPIAAQRNVILFLLVSLCVAAWVWIAWRGGSGLHAGASMGSPTMGMGAAVFVAMWLAMTVAMMFPAAAPMILAFHRAQARKRESGRAFVATWVFLAGYMLVWTASGVAAYAGALAFEAIAARAALAPDSAARIGGAVLAAAGLYQLTPLKDMCLSKCRTPASFIMTSWREGALGALQMGALHGAYCLGCCWLLCAIMFPLGMMNVAALATVTVVVFAERTLPGGAVAARAFGVALLAYGVVAILLPRALPAFHG